MELKAVDYSKNEYLTDLVELFPDLETGCTKYDIASRFALIRSPNAH